MAASEGWWDQFVRQLGTKKVKEARGGSGSAPQSMLSEEAAPVEGSKSAPQEQGAGMSAMQGAGAASGSDSALGGAAQGAMVAGPVGAVAGAALGLAKGMAAQAKQKRELRAQAIAKQGEIAQQTGTSQNAALASILEGLKSAFIR